MEITDNDYIMSVKYDGANLDHGMMDAKKLSVVLDGFDEILKFFLFKECSEPEVKDIEIPVKISKGSVDISIPQIIEQIVSFKSIVGAYAINTAIQSAKDGFFETGFVNDLRKLINCAAISAMWVIKIAKHLNGFEKSTNDIKIIPNSSEVELVSDDGVILRVPIKEFERYLESNEKIFSKSVSILNNKTSFTLSLQTESGFESVTITHNEKAIFCIEDKNDDDTVSLPELEHGEYVEIVGEIIRLTENTNSIGLSYRGHTITCKPDHKCIVYYKDKIVSKESDHVLAKVKISGIVDRTDRNGGFKMKKPVINFSDIVVLNDSLEQDLFQ